MCLCLFQIIFKYTVLNISTLSTSHQKFASEVLTYSPYHFIYNVPNFLELLCIISFWSIPGLGQGFLKYLCGHCLQVYLTLCSSVSFVGSISSLSPYDGAIQTIVLFCSFHTQVILKHGSLYNYGYGKTSLQNI